MIEIIMTKRHLRLAYYRTETGASQRTNLELETANKQLTFD